MNGREIEVKLLVRSLEKIEKLLLDLGASLIQPRGFEVNRRFDRPDGSLRAAGKVLRLRQDTQAILTYKGEGTSEAGILSRTELEITVSDAEAAQTILEALGYNQSAVYEKYRRVYELGDCEVMLDELPYGDFVEIEGPDAASIHETTGRLRLNINRAVEDSYLGLFERYCALSGLEPGRLTFEALHGVHPSPRELGVEPADQE